MEVKSIPDKTWLFEQIDDAEAGRFTSFEKKFLRWVCSRWGYESL